MAKPAGPKRMRYLEIGFGKAERIARYARQKRSKKRVFRGIDLKKRTGLLVPTRQHNVKLMFGDAAKRMKKLPANSFDVIAMDFAEVLKKKATDTTVGEDKGIVRVRGQYVEAIPGFFAQAKRVLQNNGRIFITMPLSEIVEIESMLRKAGFAEIRHAEVPEKNKNNTYEMRKHFEYAETEYIAMPYLVSAVKRSN